MPSATLLFLIMIIGLLLWTNALDDPRKKGADDTTVDMSRTPYFMRYNAPVRTRDMARSLVPVIALAPATSTPAHGSQSGFSGFTPRIA